MGFTPNYLSAATAMAWGSSRMKCKENSGKKQVVDSTYLSKTKLV